MVICDLVAVLFSIGNSVYFLNLAARIQINAHEPLGLELYTARALFEHNAQDVHNPRIIYSITGGTCAGQCSIDGITGNLPFMVYFDICLH